MAEHAHKYAVSDKHAAFAEKIVRQIMSRYGVSPTYYKDYLGAAYTGLLEAAERFDSSSTIPFEKYAFLRVRGAVIDHIRESFGESAKANKAIRILQASDCLSEDFNQIRAQLNTDQIDEALAEVLDYAAKGALIFRLNYLECEEDTINDLSTSHSAEEQMIEYEINETLAAAIKCLPPREQQIVLMYYYQDLSFKEIADILLVTRSWVSRMHSRAIRVLRDKMDEIMSQQEQLAV